MTAGVVGLVLAAVATGAMTAGVVGLVLAVFLSFFAAFFSASLAFFAALALVSFSLAVSASAFCTSAPPRGHRSRGRRTPRLESLPWERNGQRKRAGGGVAKLEARRTGE